MKCTKFINVKMPAPEYRAGFRVLRKKTGLWATLRIAVPAFFRAVIVTHKALDRSDPAESAKAALKNRFQLLAYIYRGLDQRYGTAQSDSIMQEVFSSGGEVFFRGFRPLEQGETLRDFAGIYRAFERNNVVFDVIEESDTRLEIVVTRCLVFEAFQELGVPGLALWMCDIAFRYFSRYHPQMRYDKDRMIARGAKTCHEVFTWHQGTRRRTRTLQ